MAILRQSNYFRIDVLLKQLQHAARCVFRVSSDVDKGQRSSVGTGWLIAPDVLVVAGYAIEFRGGALPSLSAEAFENGLVSWSARSVGPITVHGEGELLGQRFPLVGVAKIDTPSPERVLPLDFADIQLGGEIAIVHYPQGNSEPFVSFGQLTFPAHHGGNLAYDANTEGGSGGAPVLNSSWKVIGMHLGGDQKAEINSGAPRVAIVSALRQSPHWPQIASFHRLADDVAALETLAAVSEAPHSDHDDVLVKAALQLSIDPGTLSSADRERLLPEVIDPTASRWVLRSFARKRIISRVGSLAALKQAYVVDKSADPGQRVIEGVLNGPPYDYADGDDAALGWWIQAVGWFADVAANLPTPKQVELTLQRRRARSHLESIAGKDFLGRVMELNRLRRWYLGASGPFLLTGIGGIGKSALVARFASELPTASLVLWLDFDRADLAPDDAVSILRAIATQAQTLLDDFPTLSFDTNNWSEQAGELGKRIAAAIVGGPAPLLILDSFEAAQYAERYAELWPVLEQVAATIPRIRILVTGRAPVPDLCLLNKPADAMHLKGLSPADARRWLQQHGVEALDTVALVNRLARGNPLILKLAVLYIKSTGGVVDIPEKLPQRIILGYLYDRILDRMQNQSFKPLARGLLVLRRVELDMIEPVFSGLVELPHGDKKVWFKELSREMALLEGGDVLELRPEVRTATLSLLEREEPDLVSKIDARAERWYAQRVEEREADVPELAELVYHRLRLGDVAGAQAAWRDGCGALLLYAPNEIRNMAARRWLKGRLEGVESPRALSQAQWERGALERIKSARARKLDRIVSGILGEREKRSVNSPLIFQDAYELRAAGRASAARALLENSSGYADAISRDRDALAALLAAEAGDLAAADALLAKIEDSARWDDRSDGQIDALAVSAARIWLAVDLDKESFFHGVWDGSAPPPPEVQTIAPFEVLFAQFKYWLRKHAPGPSTEASPRFLDVTREKEAEALPSVVERERVAAVPGEPEMLRIHRAKLLDEWKSGGAWVPTAIKPRDVGLDDDGVWALVLDLAQRGWRRWWLASERAFLWRACRVAIEPFAVRAQLRSAIVGTAALFAQRQERFVLSLPPSGSFISALFRSDAANMSYICRLQDLRMRPPRESDDVEKSGPIFRPILARRTSVVPVIKWTVSREDDHAAVRIATDFSGWRTTSRSYPFGLEADCLALAVVTPDPLRCLVADLAGLEGQMA